MVTIAVAVPPRWRGSFFPGELWDRLAALGELRWDDEADLSDPAEFLRLVAPADVVVTSWACPPLDETVLAGAGNLRLMAHTGGSVKGYADRAVFGRGVRVTQAGAAMAPAVAEQALALTLALLHRVHRFDHALRSGTCWYRAKDAPPRHELRDCAVGVVGASRTGRAYVELVRAMGGTVRVFDPYLDEAGASRLGAERVGLRTLLSSSTVVALHAPALPETARMIGARELALIPDGGLVVNTARAALVDTEALLAELRSGRLDAALDVFDEEPLPVAHPLRALPNVLLTPHEAAGTRESRRRAGEIVLDEIARFLAGKPLRHEVTAAMLPRIG